MSFSVYIPICGGDRKKEIKVIEWIILNKDKIAIKWNEEYTHLVFDDGKDALYFKLIFGL